jgi:hypothetical protein
MALLFVCLRRACLLIHDGFAASEGLRLTVLLAVLAVHNDQRCERPDERAGYEPEQKCKPAEMSRRARQVRDLVIGRRHRARTICSR